MSSISTTRIVREAIADHLKPQLTIDRIVHDELTALRERRAEHQQEQTP